MEYTSHCTWLHRRADADGLPVIWFDIDNTLYSRAAGIDEEMARLIGQYFLKLGLGADEAHKLHKRYFRDYGLSIRGLVRDFHRDPLEYNEQCDDALPLEDLLRPDPTVTKLLQRIDRSKFRVMGLTNAYKKHALRVLKILELTDQFEGVVSCDYTHPTFACKPEPRYFEESMHYVGSQETTNYFIDDSALNVRGALEFGWDKTLLFLEGDREKPEDIPIAIRNLEELYQTWPECFKPLEN